MSTKENIQLNCDDVSEPVNWVEEKLLGGYNQTTASWSMYWHNIYNTVSISY